MYSYDLFSSVYKSCNPSAIMICCFSVYKNWNPSAIMISFLQFVKAGIHLQL